MKNRYVKHLNSSKPPWQADSEFLSLSAEFDTWRRSLPQSLLWNAGAIYARKGSSQLGALTLLWCTFHQTLVDLYRIGMPILFRIQKDIEFPPDQQEFLENCQRACFDNAREVSNILAEALRHGIKVLADTWLCIIAHDSTKVMLYYLKLNERLQSLDRREIDETIALAQGNLEGLLRMRPMVATAEHCVSQWQFKPFVDFNIVPNFLGIVFIRDQDDGCSRNKTPVVKYDLDCSTGPR